METRWNQKNFPIADMSRKTQKNGKKTTTEKQLEKGISEEIFLEGQPSDIVEISNDWTDKADWKLMAHQALDSMEKLYPNVKITVETLERKALNEEDIRQLAVQSGWGYHLVLSKSFYDEMTSGAEKFDRCRSLLENMCVQMGSSGNGVQGCGTYLTEQSMRYWVVEEEGQYQRGTAKKTYHSSAVNLLPDQVNEKKGWSKRMKSNPTGSKKEEVEESWKNKFHYSAGSANYDTAAKYTKMARAGNKPQVQLVLSEVNQSISALRIVSCLGEDDEKRKAAMVIRSLQKLLQRGRKKMKRFDTEQILQLREKRALEQKLKKKAELIRQELQKKRNKRYIEDRRMEEDGKNEERVINQAQQKYAAAVAKIQMGSESIALEPVTVTDTSSAGGDGSGCDIIDASVGVSAEIMF